MVVGVVTAQETIEVESATAEQALNDLELEIAREACYLIMAVIHGKLPPPISEHTARYLLVTRIKERTGCDVDADHLWLHDVADVVYAALVVDGQR